MSEIKKKMQERLLKLSELRKKCEEGRQLNHREMLAEHARNKLPKNWEVRKERAEKSLEYDNLKKEAAEQGKDYDRLVTRNVTAIDADKYEKKRKKKIDPNDFVDYEEAAVRKYQRLIRNMPEPDMAYYKKQRQEMGDEVFYGNLNFSIVGLHKDKPEAIDRLVEDVNKQVARRSKFSRRRTYNPDADIDYINERNSKFNKKLDRYYGEYTAEIKQNLERGTAI